jgi:acyl carrier protein
MSIIKPVTREAVLSLMQSLRIDCDPSTLDPTEDFRKQGIDSLDLANIVFGIEDVFEVTVTDESLEAGEWGSVDRIVETLNRLCARARDLR